MVLEFGFACSCALVLGLFVAWVLVDFGCDLVFLLMVGVCAVGL